MRRITRLVILFPVAWFATSCADHPRFPPGIDGYQCAHYQITPAGKVGASAIPDYRGGYRTFSMQWQARSEGNGSLEATVYWSDGRDAISPPAWLSISHVVVERVPPRHSVFRLKLSSGETREEPFTLPRNWQRVTGPYRFGASVLVRDSLFIEEFTRAQWVEVSVIDPSGVIHAQRQLDLTGVPEAVAVMRQLGGQVKSELSSYQDRCFAIPHEELEGVVLRTRPAADRETPENIRTGTSGSAPRPAADGHC